MLQCAVGALATTIIDSTNAAAADAMMLECNSAQQHDSHQPVANATAGFLSVSF
jgi:hypothetical protein